jgi:hypothetical protein
MEEDDASFTRGIPPTLNVLYGDQGGQETNDPKNERHSSYWSTERLDPVLCIYITYHLKRDNGFS